MSYRGLDLCAMNTSRNAKEAVLCLSLTRTQIHSVFCKDVLLSLSAWENVLSTQT